MVYHLKNLIKNNNFNKLMSCIFGYQLWLMLSATTINTRKITVPLCFYGSHDRIVEQAPEEITVILEAQRNVLANLDTNNLGVHINKDELNPGMQALTITNDNLLFTNSIKIHETIPSNIRITIKEV